MNPAIIALRGQAPIMDIPPSEALTRAVPTATTGTAIATPPSAPGTTPTVEAVVIAARAQLAAAALPGFLLELDIGGVRLEADSAQALPAGTRLQLRETMPGRYRVEGMSTPPVALREARIAEVLRSELLRQAMPREVVQALERQLAASGLDPALRHAIEALLRRLPTPTEVQQPAGLRAALYNSGSFLEPRLLRALSYAAPGAAGGALPTALTAPAALAWVALRRLYGALTGTSPAATAPAAPPPAVTRSAPAAQPISAQTAPPPPTASAAASASSPGSSVPGTPVAAPVPPASLPGVPVPAARSGTERAAGSPAPPTQAALAGIAAGSTPVQGSVAPAAAPVGGSPPAHPAPGSSAARTTAPPHLSLPASRGSVTPAPDAPDAPSGVPLSAHRSATVTSPVTSLRSPAAGPLPTPGTAPRAPGVPGVPAVTLSAGSPPLQNGVVPVPAPPLTAPGLAAPSGLPPAPGAATAAVTLDAAHIPSAPVPGAAGSAAPQGGSPSPPAPEFPAAVLASDLKAQWLLLRATLASVLSRVPTVPREGATAQAPASSAAIPAGTALPLYTARGLLAPGAVTAAPAPAQPVAGEPGPARGIDTVERLLGQVEGALSRTRVHQLVALPEARAAAENLPPPTWIAEIPLLHPRGVDVLQVRIEEHGGHGQPVGGERQWQVMLSLDTETLGTLHALVQLAGQRLRATLWAERAATLHAARAALGELDSALRAQGVEVERLECMPGRPPHDTLQARERLLDVRT